MVRCTFWGKIWYSSDESLIYIKRLIMSYKYCFCITSWVNCIKHNHELYQKSFELYHTYPCNNQNERLKLSQFRVFTWRVSKVPWLISNNSQNIKVVRLISQVELYHGYSWTISMLQLVSIKKHTEQYQSLSEQLYQS